MTQPNKNQSGRYADGEGERPGRLTRSPMVRALIHIAALIGALYAPSGFAQQSHERATHTPPSESRVQASDTQAITRFWDYVICVNDRDPAGVDALVSRFFKGSDMKRDLKAFAQRNTACMGKWDDELSMHPVVYASGLAGVRLARKYQSGPVPTYAEVPTIFTADAIAKVNNLDQRKQLVMYSFAECVVRRDPATVFALMLTRWQSKEAGALWSKLGDPMGLCVPAKEGDKLAFDKFLLQWNFAYAALALDNSIKR
ncbi:hypothetical protein WBP07_07835 [Novosphingobium sp. BL-8A]|uniref:hypothetical protein n=1 Tax=Novosphingobium sp. BL-8A TaxID=3127639 RepID=UPI003758202E